jgi:hypothetical protein
MGLHVYLMLEISLLSCLLRQSKIDTCHMKYETYFKIDRMDTMALESFCFLCLSVNIDILLFVGNKKNVTHL